MATKNRLIIIFHYFLYLGKVLAVRASCPGFSHLLYDVSAGWLTVMGLTQLILTSPLIRVDASELCLKSAPAVAATASVSII